MSALGTASEIVAPTVTIRLMQEWGECAWTAPDLAKQEFRQEMETSSLRFILGLRP